MDEKKREQPISFRAWKKNSDGTESNEEWLKDFVKGSMFKQVFGKSISKFLNFLIMTYRGRNVEQSIEEIKEHGDDNE